MSPPETLSFFLCVSGSLTALTLFCTRRDEDEDEVDDSLPQAEGSPPKNKRPAPTTVSNGQVATKKLRVRPKSVPLLCAS